MRRDEAGTLDRDILAEAAEVLSFTLDPARVFERFTELLVPSAADTAAVFVPDDRGGARLACHAHADPAEHAHADALYRRAPIVAGAPTPVLRVLASGEPELYTAVSDDQLESGARGSAHLEAMRAMGIQSVIFAPLVGRERIVGVLSLVSTRAGRRYTPVDLSLARKLARLAAIAVENARLIESERAARRAAERFQRLTAALAQVVTREQAATTMASAARDAFDATMSFVSLVGVSGALELVAHAGYDEVPDLCGALEPGERSPLVDALERREPVFLASPEERAERYPTLAFAAAVDALAWAVVPIVSPSRAYGVVSLGFPAPRTFAPDERETLLAMARQCASTMERVRLFRAEREAREALAKTHRMLEALIEASPAAITLLDELGAVQMWNASAERLFGWRSHEVVGKRFDALGGEGELDALIAGVVRGEAANGVETRQMRRDGEPIDLTVWAAPIDRAGAAPLCLVVLIDVTDRKRAEAAAREASRRKDEFFAMLGHELRNPLAPILTAIELMKLDGGPAAEEAPRVIERHARPLVRRVADLLDLARVTRGKIELALDDVEVWSVIERAIEMASPLLEEQAHALEVDVPRRGLLVRGDPVRLVQVFQNLLSNSAKYTPPRGRLRVRARRAGEWVEISVQDDGAGIAPELLPVLFHPFVQGERTIDRAQGGLGLGLALVQSLVALHGGTVSATSEGVGRGTVMTVRVPAAAARRISSVPASRAGDALPVPKAGRRVLVVDDNADAAEMLAILLRRRGHVVEVAYDGPSALEVFDRFRPDAALLDIGLPVMDGYELAQRVQRRAKRDLLLVAVTGYGQDTDRERSRAVGFAHHLVKPVNTKELVAILAAGQC